MSASASIAITRSAPSDVVDVRSGEEAGLLSVTETAGAHGVDRLTLAHASGPVPAALPARLCFKESVPWEGSFIRAEISQRQIFQKYVTDVNVT